MPFGKRLKQLRRQHDLTQQQMCDRLHIDQSAYSKYENDKISPCTDFIDQVAREFNVSSEWLIASDQNAVTFENGSINHGNGIVQAHNFYTIPKEIFDTFIHQQQLLQELLQKLVNRL